MRLEKRVTWVKKAEFSKKDLPELKFARQIDLVDCHSAEDAYREIAKAIPVVGFTFGGNADAMVDVLNDLPSGKHYFVLRNIERLGKAHLDRLLQVLSIRTSEGVGYGDGEAYFVLIT